MGGFLSLRPASGKMLQQRRPRPLPTWVSGEERVSEDEAGLSWGHPPRGEAPGTGQRAQEVLAQNLWPRLA